ncbi:MAG: GNAT family N-acetyltransferase [Campylobacteraceae bacterium]|jgi:ribosomal protein S18 acetylase RimI-like enzyme|nr:GNAT family N-acetyltransferase [Campylobacteraceae bacterium]
MDKNVVITPCDYTNEKHTRAVETLINAYISDDMGGGEVLDEGRKVRLIEELRGRFGAVVLLAKMGEEFVGLLVAFENFSTFLVKPMVNIHDIIVLKEYRGQGIGRRLMEAVIDEAKRRGSARVTLEVREDNGVAQKLYRELGFKETSPKMLYWRMEL